MYTTPTDIIHDIDKIATDYYPDEFGLPTHDEATMQKMVDVVQKYANDNYKLGSEDIVMMAEDGLTKVFTLSELEKYSKDYHDYENDVKIYPFLHGYTMTFYEWLINTIKPKQDGL